MHDAAHQRHVVVFRSPAQRVDHQLLGHHPHELRRILHQSPTQIGYAVQLGAIHQLAGRVDRAPVIQRAVLSDSVKILQAQSNGIHDLVAAAAGFVFAMQFHLLAHGRFQAAANGAFLLRKIRNIWRRSWRLHAQEDLQRELTPAHRRSPVGNRRDR